MKYNLKQPLLWLLGVLAAVPIVYAQDLTQLLKPIVDILGPGGLYSLYQLAPMLWDSVLALVLFISIGNRLLGERFGKTPATIIGIILAIGFGTFETISGFNLSTIAPFAFFILLLVLGTAVYSWISNYVHNKWIAFAAAFITIWLAAMMMSKLIFGQLAKQYPSLMAWMELLLVICVISVLVYAGNRMFRRRHGSTSDASSPAHSAARAEENALETDIATADRERQALAAERAALMAERAELQNMGQDTVADAGTAAAEIQEATGIEQDEAQIGSFATNAENILSQAANASPAEQQALIQQLDSQKPMLQQEMQRIAARMGAFGQRIGSEKAVRADEQALQRFAAYVDKTEKAAFDAEKKTENDLKNAEDLLRQQWNNALSSYNNNKPEMKQGPALQFAERMLPAAEQVYQQHLKQYPELLARYSMLAKSAEQIQQTQQRMKELVNDRQALRQKAHNILMKLPDELKACNSDIQEGIDLRSRDMLEKGMREREAVQATLKEAVEDEMKVYNIDRELTTQEQQLLQLLQYRDQNEDPFLRDTAQLLKQQEQLLEQIDTADLAANAAMMSRNNSPDNMVDIQRVGFSKFENKTFTKNKQVAQKFIEGVFGSLQAELGSSLSKSPNKENSVYAGAAQAVSQELQQLGQEWNQYIQKKTLENFRQEQGLDKSGFAAWSQKVNKQ